MNHILAGTDLTDDAMAAVATGGLLARASGATLHVLHVDQGEGDSGERSKLQHLLSEHVSTAVQHECPLVLHLLSGKPHSTFTDAAERLGAELLVLGSHRPRRLFDGLLGTTADRVLRTASVPVLIANRPMPALPRNVILATDLSPTADRALDLASQWLADLEGSDTGGPAGAIFVELLHVSAFAHPGYRPGFSVEGLKARAAATERAGSGRLKVRARIMSAPLAPEGILQAATSENADLIVMGTHGHGGLARALLGSVASEVSRTAPFPVLLVPPGVG